MRGPRELHLRLWSAESLAERLLGLYAEAIDAGRELIPKAGQHCRQKETAWNQGRRCRSWLSCVSPSPYRSSCGRRRKPPTRDTDFLIRYSVLLYAAFRMSVILWKDQVRPVAGVFWMFVYICLGVVPLAQLSTGASTILAVQVDDTTLYATTAITLLGCVSFDLAYHLRLFANGWSGRRLFTRCGAWTPCGSLR